MAIRIIEGKIGSGKTYYAVNHVLRSWFRWCNTTDAWVIKKTDIDVKVYTNIKNMKLGFDLDVAIEAAGGLDSFFNVEYQEKFCHNSNVIYIIDEAQGGNYFHRKFYDVKVFLFFQMHRHLGIDIYLVTQDTKCLAKELRELAEYVIVAVPRTKSIGNCFTYKFYSGKDCFNTKRIKKDSKVFNMYRSMLLKEGEKVKSALVKYIVYFVLIIVVTGLAFKFVFLNIILGMGKSSSQDLQQEIVKSIVPDTIESSEDVNNDHMYNIVGKIGNEYVVKTDKGLKRVKIKASENKRIGDQIKIEKL
jgi:zona occludens toxin